MCSGGVLVPGRTTCSTGVCQCRAVPYAGWGCVGVGPYHMLGGGVSVSGRTTCTGGCSCAVPHAQQQQVVELVLAEAAGDGDEEGQAEERRAGVVVARLLALLPQVHGDQHVVLVLRPAHRHLKPDTQGKRPLRAAKFGRH